MAQYYSSIKTMKSARIGTIMPWGGDGNEGFTIANLPKGWIVCDGRLKDAFEFPLLASELGTTYGGNMTGGFPNYAGQFQLPDIANKAMIDLERSMLSDTKYQMGQSDAYVEVGLLLGDGTGDEPALDFGSVDSLPITYDAAADIDFSFNNPNLQLSARMTGQTISDPDFFTSITTISRKLGINHIPAHSHRTTFQSANAGFFGPQAFDTATVVMGGDDGHDRCPNHTRSEYNTCEIRGGNSKNPDWEDAATLLAYYGDEDHEHTLPRMNRFHEFINDTGKDYWSTVPAPSWHDGTPTRNSPKAPSQTVNRPNVGEVTDDFQYSPFDNDPTTTDKPDHYHPSWVGMHPRPQIQANRRNYFGYDTGSTLNQIPDNPEDPANWFTVTGVSITPGVDTIILPTGTDIRTTKTEGTAPNTTTYYIEDKIRPYRLVDGDKIEPGTHITSISRSGNDVTDYVYTIELSQNTLPGPYADPNATYTLVFKDATWPTTLSNLGSLDPDDATFGMHNHGTFDLQMSVGSLKPQPTYSLSDVSLGSVTPVNEDNALNITVTTTQPSMASVYIIKAY